jgi:hypothetical protein
VSSPKDSGLMLDTKASVAAEVTARVFVFQRVAYGVPRFSVGSDDQHSTLPSLPQTHLIEVRW